MLPITRILPPKHLLITKRPALDRWTTPVQRKQHYTRYYKRNRQHLVELQALCRRAMVRFSNITYIFLLLHKHNS